MSRAVHRGSLAGMFKKELESISIDADADYHRTSSTLPKGENFAPSMGGSSRTSQPQPTQQHRPSESAKVSSRGNKFSQKQATAVEFDHFPESTNVAQNYTDILSSHALESSIHFETPKAPPGHAESEIEVGDEFKHDANPTDFKILYGVEMPGTTLILGPPGFGKTSLMVNILRHLRDQIDLIFFFTLTASTKEKLQNFMPRQLVFINLAPTLKEFEKMKKEQGADYNGQDAVVLLSDKLQEILDFQMRINSQFGPKKFSDGTTRPGGLRTCVVLDDILINAQFKGVMDRAVVNYIKLGHRANIITILTAHRERDIYGNNAEQIDKRIYVGSWEKVFEDDGGNTAKAIAKSVESIPSLSTFTKFRSVYSSLVKKGTAMVVHNPSALCPTSTGNVEVTFFQCPGIEHIPKFVLCHPDIYRLLHFYSAPVMNVVVRDDGSMDYMPILSKGLERKPIAIKDTLPPEDVVPGGKRTQAVEKEINIVLPATKTVGVKNFTIVNNLRQRN